MNGIFPVKFAMMKQRKGSKVDIEKKRLSLRLTQQFHQLEGS